MILVWAAARVPYLWLRLPPLVQDDSFCYPPFRQTLRNPHYPFLFGSFLHTFDLDTAVILQHVSILIASLLLYRIGRDAFSRTAGLVTGTFIAVHPGLSIYAQTFMSETLFVSFIALHLWAFWTAIRKRTFSWFFLAGVLSGLACHVRPTAQLQPLIAAAVLLPSFRLSVGWKRYAALTGSLFLGFAIVVAPVAFLVKTHYGRFTISTGLYPLARDRMVLGADMPLAAVKVDDPVQARVRDFLATSYDVGTGTLDDIKPYVDGSQTTAIRLESVILDLWRHYVTTYPLRYAMESLRGLWTELNNVHELRQNVKDSQKWLDYFLSYPGAINSPLLQLILRKAPDPRRVEIVSAWFDAIGRGLAFIPLVLTVFALSIIGAVLWKEEAGIYLRFVLLSTVPLFVIPFFLGAPVGRYRNPFDLLLAVFLGAAVSMVQRIFDALLARMKTHGKPLVAPKIDNPAAVHSS